VKAVRQATYSDGRYDGHTLAEWLPAVVETIVARFNPLKVIVFGSLGRGEEGHDIDLLVVFPTAKDKRRTAVAVRSSIEAPVPIDVIITDPDEIARRGHLIGTILEPALREGRVVYERP
jgi:uncharacterized protein